MGERADGVGELIKIGVERGRKARPKLKVGIFIAEEAARQSAWKKSCLMTIPGADFFN